MSQTLQIAPDSPSALVIGFNIHGLAIARALSRAGVEVHALVQNAELPSAKTRYAKTMICEEIAGPNLVPLLIQQWERFYNGKPAILFPTSDSMVRQIAERWRDLEGRYQISWANCRQLVLELQRKDSLEKYCESAGILYPHTQIIKDESDLMEQDTRHKFPAVVKPARPLSSFKAIVVDSIGGVKELIRRYPMDLPFLLQTYIPGSEECLWFCTMYVHDGKEVCAFTGRKIRSMPRDTGMGSIVEHRPNKDVLNLSRQFIADLPISGPVAIEFKQDQDGRFWFIEPNVGRTEYSVDLIIQHGINLPFLEYCAVANGSVKPPQFRPVSTIWFDTERDRMGFLWAASKSRSWKPFHRSPVFPYFGHSDPGPLYTSLRQEAVQIMKGAYRRITNLHLPNSK